MTKKSFADHRDSYYQRLVRACFGPLPEDDEACQREVHPDNPLYYYIAGLLFPERVPSERVEKLHEERPKDAEPEDDSDGEPVTLEVPEVNAREILDEPEEEPLNLANEYMPAAMGLTFRVPKDAVIEIGTTFGTYQKVITEKETASGDAANEDGTKEKGKSVTWRREPHAFQNQFSVTEGRTKKISLGKDARLHLTLRKEKDDCIKVSLMLINQSPESEGREDLAERVLFQPRLRLSALGGGRVFLPLERAAPQSDDAERASLDLLFRDSHSFGWGHGCAVVWSGVSPNGETSGCAGLETAFLPKHEVKVIAPRKAKNPMLPNHSLKMAMDFLSGEELKEGITPTVALKMFCKDYHAWIEGQRHELGNLDVTYREAGTRHLDAATLCLQRMQAGVVLLESDAQVFLAFQLANHAMATQIRHAHAAKSDETKKIIPEWRPFQLAFLLMNLCAFADPSHEDRRTVDLIWFPTGGGKTEAYLGLAAFAMFLRRLRQPDKLGTQILMRYTLRLLTTQQFQRAAGLILAMEHMRQTGFRKVDLGKHPFSIGLWAGDSLTPNRRDKALSFLKNFRKNHKKEDNVFQILKCPWCSTAWDDSKKPGYDVDAPNGNKTVVFKCPSESCYWHKDSAPIRIIDEDIYDEPPTLVLGTVDKFAQIAWRDDVGKLFGLKGGYTSPELIIQDELHLISGPLGSMVGLYEVAIERMCEYGGETPKIVASTATICHAADQCKGLYGNRPVMQFPPQGLSAGDSYFALEDLEKEGRMYVGVFPSLGRPQRDVQEYLVSHLLQNLRNETMDPEAEPFASVYGTLVWYFNSLRELGMAVSMCQSELPNRLKAIQRYLGLNNEARRWIRQHTELTSRRTAAEIPQILKDMEIPWTHKPEKGAYPIDILQATNMIAVGVDISRLGLMLVHGQPKTTSEYIQASSRVGRDSNAPGMVVTLYNPAKNRDRSHFEQFVGYHQALYRYVEPTSVTPFSPPARERGLRGVLIGLARQVVGLEKPSQLKSRRAALEREAEWLLKRLADTSPEERAAASEEIESYLNEWERLEPNEYGPMFGLAVSKSLARPFGQHFHPEFQKYAWPVLTSLRSVDATTRGRVIVQEPERDL